MPTPRDDHALLRAYVERRDDAAFAELVARHADMVYAAALRQVGRGGLAEDVTQAAFILLARKASKIPERIVVAAWLHKATRYTALNAMKIEQRRRAHERRAGQQVVAASRGLVAALPSGANVEVHWAQGAALLDEGIARLGGKDREAVVLRFLERRSFFDVGAALGVSEEAAQMRVGRAVEKLRGFFRRRGLVVSAATVMATVNANAGVAAPIAFKQKLAPAIMEAVNATAPTPASIADGAGRAMDVSAARTAAAFVCGSVAAAVVIGLLIFHVAVRDRNELPAANPPPTQSRLNVPEDERRSVRAAEDHPASTWLAAPILAAARQLSDLFVRR